MNSKEKRFLEVDEILDRFNDARRLGLKDCEVDRFLLFRILELEEEVARLSDIVHGTED